MVKSKYPSERTWFAFPIEVRYNSRGTVIPRPWQNASLERKGRVPTTSSAEASHFVVRYHEMDKLNCKIQDVLNMTWNELEQACLSCHKCGLAKERNHVVIGRGNPDAPILFVGEGPGRQEDEQGIPFVGQAGKLLDLALTSCLFTPDQYYIANVVKCRPPQNRTPIREECEACLPYLRQQFALIRPKIVVCLGAVAVTSLVSPDAKITSARGVWTQRKETLFFATYHPAALLRDESKKLVMWQDLRRVRQKLDELLISV